jgi:hypothetical protein
VDYRPNANTSNVMKNKAHYGELTNGRGTVKEGSLKSEYG